MRIILASQSPRRQSILKDAGFTFDTIPSMFDESSVIPTTKEAYVMTLSYHKAKEVHNKHQESIVIGADTIVYVKDETNEYYLGKPKDKKHAKEMLSMLSGCTHQVLTGVTVISKHKEETFYTESNVTFKALSELEMMLIFIQKNLLIKLVHMPFKGKDINSFQLTMVIFLRLWDSQ